MEFENSGSDREDTQRSGRKRVWAPVLVLVFVAAVAGVTTYLFSPVGSTSKGAGTAAGPTPVVVSTAIVTPDMVVSTLTEKSIVIPTLELPIIPNKAGWVRKVMVKKGQKVSAGDVIAVVQVADDSASNAITQYQSVAQGLAFAADQLGNAQNMLMTTHAGVEISQTRLEQSVSARRSVETSIAQLKQEIDVASKSLDQRNSEVQRQKSLYDLGAISRNDLASAEADQAAASERFKKAKSDLESAQVDSISAVSQVKSDEQALVQAKAAEQQAAASVKSARKSLMAEQTLADRALGKVKSAQSSQQWQAMPSPANGVVLGISAQQGSLVTPGIEMARIKPTGVAVVAFDTEDQQATKVKAGMPAVVQITKPGKGAFPGRVVAIAPTTEGGVKRNRIFIQAQDKRNILKPGVQTTAMVRLQKIRALTIPNMAVNWLSHGPAVWVVEAGIARIRPIAVSGTAGKMVVVSKGLQNGESVVVKSDDMLRDGIPVIVDRQLTGLLR